MSLPVPTYHWDADGDANGVGDVVALRGGVNLAWNGGTPTYGPRPPKAFSGLSFVTAETGNQSLSAAGLRLAHSGDSGLSFSACFRPSDLSEEHFVVSGFAGSSGGGVGLRYDGPSDQWEVLARNGGAGGTGTTYNFPDAGIAIGAFAHVAVVMDFGGSPTVALYRDGVAIGMPQPLVNVPFNNSGTPSIQIGSSPNSSLSNWRGDIGDVRVWRNVILTPAQVAELAAGPVASTLRPIGAAFRPPFRSPFAPAIQ